jgi:hypothetical protein
MSIGHAVVSVGSNLKHVGIVIGGCNFVGYVASAVFETHKITDLVGVGSFVAAAVSLTMRNPALLTPISTIPAAANANAGIMGKCVQIGAIRACTGTARVLIANSLVIIWGARLSTYLFNRVLKLGEDKRLDKVQNDNLRTRNCRKFRICIFYSSSYYPSSFHQFYKQPGESYLDPNKSFYPLKLSGFWIIQAAWGFICCLPITLLNSVAVNSAISTTSGACLSISRSLSI